MSIASEISRLQGAKADIKTAIEAKGVTVPETAKLDEYDTYIAQITTEAPVNESIQLWSIDSNQHYYRSAIEIGDVTTIPTETCQNNTEVVEAMIPDTITNTGTYTFDGCTSLRKVNLDNVTEIGNYCFQNCTGLTSIDLSNVEVLDAYCFSGCTNLATVNFGNNITTINNRAFNGAGITGDVSLPSLTGYLGNTGVRAFYNTSITSVSNLGTITRTKDESFRSCDSLESVVLPSTIEYIMYMTFYQCPLLDWVTILATTPPQLGSSAFSGSYKLRVRVPYSADHSVLSAYKNSEIENWVSFSHRVYEMDPPNLYPIPSGYTELTHITCTGEQYIDTGLVGNQTVSADISLYSNYTNTTMALFGRNTGDNATSILVNIANSSGTTRLGGGYKSMGWGTRPDWVISFRYNSVARNTTATSWSGTVGEFTTNDNLLLGWSGSSSVDKFKGDIQSCRIWMDGILTRDYKPCKNASNVVGMWDAVNGVFYPSVSGTDFTE